jgi:hypothetical protein
LFASPVATGEANESTRGTSSIACSGLVGLETLFVNFFVLTELDFEIVPCDARAEETAGRLRACSGAERASTSWYEAVECTEPTRCRGGFDRLLEAERWRWPSSKVRVRGREV